MMPLPLIAWALVNAAGICDAGDAQSTCTVTKAHALHDGDSLVIAGALEIDEGGELHADVGAHVLIKAAGGLSIAAGGRIAGAGGALTIEAPGGLTVDGELAAGNLTVSAGAVGGDGGISANAGATWTSEGKFTGEMTVSGGAFHQTIAAGPCDAGTLDTVCTVSTKTYLDSAAVFQGKGGMVVAAGGELLSLDPKGSLTLRLDGDLVVDPEGAVIAPAATFVVNAFNVNGLVRGNVTATAVSAAVNGTVSANGHGFASARADATSDGGPGRGYLPGGGGSHGGAGGVSSIGAQTSETPYGNDYQPVEHGSAGGDGGDTPGGRGGGAIKLVVARALTVNGVVSANGDTPANPPNCTETAGGGAGGSVWLSAESFSGSGLVSADGGNGAQEACEDAQTGGGGGGGGRVAIYHAASTYAGIKRAEGGLAAAYNENGAFRGPSTNGAAGSVLVNP